MHCRSGWLQDAPDAVLGGVEGELPSIPDTLSAHRTRNNQLLLAALAQIQSTVDDAIARVGRDRVAVVLGTSTSGLNEGDEHVRLTLNGEASTRWQYPQQELGDPSRFLANWLQGPAYTLSTACSSSARAIISGRRLIDAGLVDIAIVGGADTLSRMPVNGFHSLESLSPTLCEPFGRDRRGITIGEAAALMVLTREPAGVALLGTGESSDATIFRRRIRRVKAPFAPLPRRSMTRVCSRRILAISTCTAPPHRSTIRLNHTWYTTSLEKTCPAVLPNTLPAIRWALPVSPKRR